MWNSPGVQPDPEVPTLFITGAPGSGKTALAKEVSELLWRVDEPHAVVDVDELCRGVLPEGTTDFNRALAVENLAAVWANFERAGVRRLVLARVIQSAEDLDLFAQAIPGCDLAVCRVTAPRSTIVDRIRRREAGSAASFLERVHASSMLRSHDSICPASWWRTVTHDRSAIFRSRCSSESTGPDRCERPDEAAHLGEGGRRPVALSPRPRTPTPGARPCGACP